MWSRKKDVIITRTRIDSAVHFNLHKIGKHKTERCGKCVNPETVKHILLECDAYERERNQS